jgi:hypothetical protein
MFSLSTRSLQQLKSTTNTPHRFIEIADGWRRLKQPLLKDRDGNLHSGRLDRETYPVIVNDRVVKVPVLTGIAFGDTRQQTSVTVLDDETLPLVLDYSVPSNGFRIRYTKISFPTNGELEKQLSVEKRADVYGIYFDFASDRLRPESTPVLSEIAALLTKNSDWTLSINGHTDNVGGDASNSRALATPQRRGARRARRSIPYRRCATRDVRLRRVTAERDERDARRSKREPARRARTPVSATRIGNDRYFFLP